MPETPQTPPPRSPGPRLVPTRRTPEPMERNPYAPPRAELAREAVEAPGEWRDWGAVVPALHGLVWIRDALRLFWERPWTWCCAFVLIFLCTSPLIHLIPAYGMDLGRWTGLILQVVFFFGIARMAHEQSEERDIHIADIFSAFRPRVLVQALIVAVIACAFGYLFGHLDAAIRKLPVIDNQNAAIRMILWFSVLGTVHYCNVILCQFFPPTLVAVAGRGVPGALLTGMVAVFRNWKAFLVNFFLLAFFFWCLFAGWTILVPMFNAATAGVGGSLRVVCHYVPVFIGAAAYMFFFNYLFILMSYAASRDIFYEEG